MWPTQSSFTACSKESRLLYLPFFVHFNFGDLHGGLGTAVKRRSAQSRLAPSVQEQLPRSIFAARKRAQELEPLSAAPRVPTPRHRPLSAAAASLRRARPPLPPEQLSGQVVCSETPRNDLQLTCPMSRVCGFICLSVNTLWRVYSRMCFACHLLVNRCIYI